MMLEKQTCIEPAIEVVLKSPITSLFKYDFRSKKLEFDDDESIDAEEFTGAQPNECRISETKPAITVAPPSIVIVREPGSVLQNLNEGQC